MTPDQTADLEILRRPRVASDELPASLVPSFTDNPQAGSGANPSLSRRAQGFDNGSAWVIPGDGMICFAARTSVTALGGEGCGSDASVNAGRMMVVGANAASPGLFGVAGIVPDGVNTVTITPTDGSPESVAVHENVYMADVRGAFSVSFDGPSGPVAVGTFAPPAASQSQPLSCGSADGSSC